LLQISSKSKVSVKFSMSTKSGSVLNKKHDEKCCRLNAILLATQRKEPGNEVVDNTDQFWECQYRKWHGSRHINEKYRNKCDFYFENKCNFLLISLKYTFSKFLLFKWDSRWQKLQILAFFGCFWNYRRLGTVLWRSVRTSDFLFLTDVNE
jgi:hypothetical protein